MGFVNMVVLLEKFEEEIIKWCEEMFEKSFIVFCFFKVVFNVDIDGFVGIQ